MLLLPRIYLLLNFLRAKLGSLVMELSVGKSPWKQKIKLAKDVVDSGSLLPLRQPRKNGTVRWMQFQLPVLLYQHQKQILNRTLCTKPIFSLHWSLIDQKLM